MNRRGFQPRGERLPAHQPSSFAAASRPVRRLRPDLLFLGVMDSTQPRHAALTVTQPLRHVLLGHLRRHPEVDDLDESSCVAGYSGAAFGRSCFNDVEPRDRAHELTVKRGQHLELLSCEASSKSTPLACRRSSTACSFPRLLARRVVVDGVANRVWSLMRGIRTYTSCTKSSASALLQTRRRKNDVARSVLGKQPLDQGRPPQRMNAPLVYESPSSKLTTKLAAPPCVHPRPFKPS